MHRSAGGGSWAVSRVQGGPQGMTHSLHPAPDITGTGLTMDRAISRLMPSISRRKAPESEEESLPDSQRYLDRLRHQQGLQEGQSIAGCECMGVHVGAWECKGPHHSWASALRSSRRERMKVDSRLSLRMVPSSEATSSSCDMSSGGTASLLLMALASSGGGWGLACSHQGVGVHGVMMVSAETQGQHQLPPMRPVVLALPP